MISETQMQHPQSGLLSAIVANALEPNNYELLRRLGQVLNIGLQSRVLLIADNADQAQRVLETELGCRVEIYGGDLGRLPYEAQYFDNAIVAVPILKGLHAIARELSRVLRPNGTLGMVVLSAYRDQLPDDEQLSAQVLPLIATTRPAAAYRAVLAECGFTAFVTDDRKRDLRRAALASYRQHMLPEHAEAPRVQDTATRAIGLLATGGVGVMLITAEKSL